MKNEPKISFKTMLLIFLSMIFGFIFAWASGFMMVYRFLNMRRSA